MTTLVFELDTDLIAEIAETDHLSIIIGAGASMEATFPSWQELLRRLLHRVALDQGLGPEETPEFVDWVLRAESPGAAGSIAQVELGHTFADRLRECLYHNVRGHAPGETSLAAATLALTYVSGDCHIATTNYDPMMREAIESVVKDLGRSETVRAVTTAGRRRSGEVLVRYLHGFVPRKGKILGSVVLTESDYVVMQDESAWQEGYFGRRLKKSLCLFVGTSMTDPNLVRYLHRNKGGRQDHVAILSRQSDVDEYERMHPRVALTRDETMRRRWAAAGLRAVVTDSFAESAQLVWEIAHRREAGDDYLDLEVRLDDWFARLRGDLLPSGQAFRDAQDRLSSVVDGLLEGVKREIRKGGRRLGSGERLGMSIWLHLPKSGELLHLADSDRAWRDRDTLIPIPAVPSSPFVAAKAFCSGSVVERSTESFVATRWNHVVAIPLYLKSDGANRLPVGAISLATTKPPKLSVFNRARDVLETRILPALAGLGASLLDPDS